MSTEYELQTYKRSTRFPRRLTKDGTDLAGFRKKLELFVGLRLDLCSPDTEGLELVNEFVDDIPEPLFRKFEGDGSIGV